MEDEINKQADHRIHFFNSFEEKEEYDAKVRAKLPPELHLANATELIKSIYEKELQTPMNKDLKFRQ